MLVKWNYNDVYDIYDDAFSELLFLISYHVITKREQICKLQRKRVVRYIQHYDV